MRKAAAALAAAGGGELVFPAGKTVLTAPFNLSSHTTLTVEAGATILCSTRGEDYPLVQVLPWIPFDSPAAPGYWPQPCVYFDGGAEGRYADGGRNITVQGPGTLDGQGKGWWSCMLKDKGLTPPCLTAPPYPAALVSNKSNTLGGGRPHLIIVRNATDVTMRNFKTHNTPNWNSKRSRPVCVFQASTGLRSSLRVGDEPPRPPRPLRQRAGRAQRSEPPLRLGL